VQRRVTPMRDDSGREKKQYNKNVGILEARIVRLRDIFDGEIQKRKMVKLAPEVEKRGLEIIRRKWPLSEMGVRILRPSPTTTQRLRDQGIEVETTEIEDLASERTRMRLVEGTDRETKKSVGENFSLLPGNSNHEMPTETVDVLAETITDPIVEVVTETIDDLISNARATKSTSANATAYMHAYTTVYMSAYATVNTSAFYDCVHGCICNCERI
jgi:hypothetical protein